MRYSHRDLLKWSFLGVFVTLSVLASGQCVVYSSNGYQVEINPVPEALLAPDDCPWGYNYNVEIDYSVSFSGENVPSSLYTLQGNLRCGNQNLFFDLPNSGGSGKAVTVSNPWNGNSNCATASLSSLDCNEIQMQVQGPGISWQVIDCNWSPLPIELLVFHAVEWEEGVRFLWTTASETNNDYFSIERSPDGENWTEVLRVDGAGNSSSPLDYDAIDPDPLPGVSYYRLKQTDFDGKYSYSKVNAVTFEHVSDRQVRMYPNPADDYISIEANSSEMEGFKVFDLQGGDMTGNVEVSVIQSSLYKINLSELPSGIYTMRTRSAVDRIYKR